MSSAAWSVTASAGLAGLERLRVGEELAEDVEVVRVGEAGEVEGVDVLDGAGEVGVDFEAVESQTTSSGGFSRSSRYCRSCL